MRRCTSPMLLGILLTAGCSGESISGPERIQSIVVTAERGTLLVGQTVQLSATPLNESGAVLAGKKIVWSSRDETVAGVSASGILTARSPGLARVVAAAEDKEGEALLTVLLVPVRTIEVILPSGPLEAGSPYTLSAAARDSVGGVLTGRVFAWQSSDERIARVSSDGIVTGGLPGTATITASTGGVSGAAAITVVVGPPASLSVTPIGRTVYPGSERQMTATLMDAAGNPIPTGPVTWENSDPSRLSISADGVARGLSGGEGVQVRASARGVTGSTPLTVVTIAHIELGLYHGCSLSDFGAVYCWGRNLNGELGKGVVSNDSSLAPIAVAGGPRFTRLTVGENHACALDVSGKAYCWGDNSAGQLGDGARVDKGAPTAVSNGISFKEITAGALHTCGVGLDEKTWCWGSGTADVPTALATSVRFQKLAAGVGFTCGLDETGHAWCWGAGEKGKLGNGSTSSSASPVAVAGGHSFKTIDAGGDGACAITVSAVLHCWGHLPWATFNLASTPQSAPTNLSFISASVFTSYSYHGCALAIDQRVHCVGTTGSGELGDGTFHHEYRSQFTEVAAPVINQYRSISVGWGSSCAIDPKGTPWCWGYWARTGRGTNDRHVAPGIQAAP